MILHKANNTQEIECSKFLDQQKYPNLDSRVKFKLTIDKTTFQHNEHKELSEVFDALFKYLKTKFVYFKDNPNSQSTNFGNFLTTSNQKFSFELWMKPELYQSLKFDKNKKEECFSFLKQQIIHLFFPLEMEKIKQNEITESLINKYFKQYSVNDVLKPLYISTVNYSFNFYYPDILIDLIYKHSFGDIFNNKDVEHKQVFFNKYDNKIINDTLASCSISKKINGQRLSLQLFLFENLKDNSILIDKFYNDYDKKTETSFSKNYKEKIENKNCTEEVIVDFLNYLTTNDLKDLKSYTIKENPELENINSINYKKERSAI